MSAASGNVWVTDDNRFVAQSLAMLLNAHQIITDVLTSAPQVMEDLNGGKEPSLLLLDVSMPQNGGSVLSYIAARPKWTFPVIVISGWDNPVCDALMPRVYKVFAKTVDPQKLVDCVREAIGERKQEEAMNNG